MIFTKQTLKRLVGEYRGPDVATYLSGEITSAEETASLVRKLREEKLRLRAEYLAACGRLEGDIVAAQRVCKHQQKTYQCDPAGGRDSHYECDVCGAIL